MEIQNIPTEALPRHVAVIMDGNGRWAQRRGKPRSDGHRAGIEAVCTTVRLARELGIRWLTLYAFSSENWNRPRPEIDVLMKLPEEYFASELQRSIDSGIRIRCIGKLEKFPANVRYVIDDAMRKTQHNSEMNLVFALSYGARQEIVDAARGLLKDHELGKIDRDAVDEKIFAEYLDEPELPDVDLLIRTGAEARISNFLLWQSAYAELYLTDVMWPAFGRTELEAALLAYAGRERRFGMTSAQVTGRGQ